MRIFTATARRARSKLFGTDVVADLFGISTKISSRTIYARLENFEKLRLVTPLGSHAPFLDVDVVPLAQTNSDRKIKSLSCVVSLKFQFNI